MPARPDACPGVLAPHDAADGALARVRLPGGVIGAGALRVVAGCAAELGDGAVHLTSRGNLQLRGLRRDDPRLARRLTAAGLLPSPAHERVRNVLASPLSGLVGGLADVRPLVGELDRGLCARPGLAALPGRFLFALDDGRGDVAAEEPDLCWRATASDAGMVLVAGATARPVPAAGAVTALLDAAEEFLAASDGAWRIPRPAAPKSASTGGVAGGPDAPSGFEPTRGEDDGVAATRGTVPREGGHRPGARLAAVVRARAGDAGHGPDAARVGRVGAALVCAPVLGEMSAWQVEELAALGPVVITPWRTIVLPAAPDEAEERLVAAGFVVDPASPVPGVSACAGRPGCAKALADVRADARAGLAAGRFTGRVHLAGCERRCGAPRGEHLALVATTRGGYAPPSSTPHQRPDGGEAPSPAVTCPPGPGGRAAVEGEAPRSAGTGPAGRGGRAPVEDEAVTRPAGPTAPAHRRSAR